MCVHVDKGNFPASCTETHQGQAHFVLAAPLGPPPFFPMPPPQKLQPLDVVSQGGDPLGDRSDPITPRGIDRQAEKDDEDLVAVVLPIAVCIFP